MGSQGTAGYLLGREDRRGSEFLQGKVGWGGPLQKQASWLAGPSASSGAQLCEEGLRLQTLLLPPQASQPRVALRHRSTTRMV